MKEYEKHTGKLNVYPIMGFVMMLLSWIVVIWLAINTGLMAWSLEEFYKIVLTPSTVSDFKTK